MYYNLIVKSANCSGFRIICCEFRKFCRGFRIICCEFRKFCRGFRKFAWWWSNFDWQRFSFLFVDFQAAKHIKEKYQCCELHSKSAILHELLLCMNTKILKSLEKEHRYSSRGSGFVSESDSQKFPIRFCITYSAKRCILLMFPECFKPPAFLCFSATRILIQIF